MPASYNKLVFLFIVLLSLGFLSQILHFNYSQEFIAGVLFKVHNVSASMFYNKSSSIQNISFPIQMFHSLQHKWMDLKNVRNKYPYPKCIEKNICKKESDKDSHLYYYNRTNHFYEMVSVSANIDISVINEHAVVPRIVHFILFSKPNREFKFYYLIALLAAYKIAKPDRIYFWHDNPPTGKYWREAKRTIKTLFLIRKQRPWTIYGRPVKIVEHASDIARLEILLEYGGIYLDTDSIVVNPIDNLLKYDLTMGYAVQGALANGIMFAKPWADFLRIWHQEYKLFTDDSWGGFSVVKAYKISQRHPNLVHIEKTSLCRPHFEELSYLFGPDKYDWRHKNYVVHLYMRFNKKNLGKNVNEMKQWNCTVGEIMRYIYTK